MSEPLDHRDTQSVCLCMLKSTEKLVVFLFGIVTHSAADVSWHSLEGIEQGFLQTMGEVAILFIVIT